MVFEQNAAGGIDFRRRFRGYGYGQMHFLSPDPPRSRWVESVMLVVAGLLGGFGLGLAYAMLMIL